MICPQCETAMIVLELDGIEIDHCFNCGGVWLDAGELEKLMKDYTATVWLTELVPVEASPERRLKCPICEKEMEKSVWALEEPVTVDCCPEGDGIWLDNGELAAIIGQGASSDNQIVSLFEEIFRKI